MEYWIRELGVSILVAFLQADRNLMISPRGTARIFWNFIYREINRFCETYLPGRSWGYPRDFFILCQRCTVTTKLVWHGAARSSLWFMKWEFTSSESGNRWKHQGQISLKLSESLAIDGSFMTSGSEVFWWRSRPKWKQPIDRFRTHLILMGFP